MKKSEVLAIFRFLLSAVGSYILGINVFGLTIDSSLWQEIVGGIMAVSGIVMSVLDKSVTTDMILGFVRQVVTVGGGLLVAAGKLKGDIVTGLLALIPLLAPYIQGVISRRKNLQLQNGTINPFDLSH